MIDRSSRPFRYVVGALALAITLILFGVPTVYVTVPSKPDPRERELLARRFLESRGFDLTGFDGRQLIIEHQNPTLYLQNVLGRQALADRMAKDPLPLFYWQIHLYKPGEIRQHWVRISLDGRIGAFTTKLGEEESGGRPTIERDRALTSRLLEQSVGSFSPGVFKEVETLISVLPKRTDHRFVFARDIDGPAGAQERISVSVQGGRLGGYRNWIKVPESFEMKQTSEDTYSDALFWTSVFGDAFLVIAAVATLLILLGPFSGNTRRNRDGEESRVVAPLRAALLVYGVLIVTVVNYSSVTLASDYSPDKPLCAFLVSHLLYLSLLSAVPALATFLMLSAGQELDRTTEEPSRVESLRRWFSGRFFDPMVLSSMGTGLILAMALGGGELLFYFLGQRYGPVVLPVQPLYANSMGTWLPFLYPLSIGIGAGITEECTFRLFGVLLLRRLRLGRFLSLLLPAMIWAFAHSKEAVFPVWVRGAELVIGGVFLGWSFLETDLLAVITAHYIYDVFAFGWPIFASGNPLATIGTAAVAAVAVVPAMLGLVARCSRSLSGSTPMN